MAHNRGPDTDSSNQSISMAMIPIEVIELILTAMPNFTLRDFKSIVLVNHFFLSMAAKISFTIIDEKKWHSFIKTKNKGFLNLFRFAKPELQNLHAHYHTEFQKNNQILPKMDAIKIMAYVLVTDHVSSLDSNILEVAIQQLTPENLEDQLNNKMDERSTLTDNENLVETEKTEKIKTLDNEIKILTHLCQFILDLQHLMNGLQDPNLKQKVNLMKNADSLPDKATESFFKSHVLNFSGANLESNTIFHFRHMNFMPHALDHTKFGKCIFSHCVFLENNLSNQTLSIGHSGRNNEKIIFSSCHLDNTLLLPTNYREGSIPTILLNGSDTSFVRFKEGNTFKNQIDFLPHTHAVNHRTVNTTVILQLHLLMNDLIFQTRNLFDKKNLIGHETTYKHDRYLAKADLLYQFIQYIATNLEQPITTLYESWAKTPSQINFFTQNGKLIKKHFSIPNNISNFDFLNLPNDFSENVYSAFSTTTQSIFNFFNSSKPSDDVLEKQNHSKETQDIAFIIQQSCRYTNEPKAQSTQEQTTGNTIFDSSHSSTSPNLN